MTVTDRHPYRRKAYKSVVLSEKQIEQKLVMQVDQRGGLCLKFISPGWNGAPDRVVLLPHGQIGFVEVKASGKMPGTIQMRRHEQIRQLGFLVFVLNDSKDIGDVLDAIQGT